MRSKIFLAVMIVSLLVFAACKPAATPTPTVAPAASPTPEAVTIQVMVVDYIPEKTDKWLEEEVVPAFQEEHPNIKVEFVYVNWGTLDTTIQGYFAAGEGADILNLGSEYVSEYGDSLAPLGEYFADWEDWDKFVPGTKDTVMWKGEPRGIPWLTAPRAYMCRMDILETAGWDKVPATLDEMVEMVKDVTVVEAGALKLKGYQSTGASTMLGTSDWQEYTNLIWTLGGELYKEDGSPNFDSPEARAALEYLYNLHKAQFSTPDIADLPEVTGPLLASDMLACFWGNLWGAPATGDPIWDSIELFPGFTDPDFPNSAAVVQVFNDWLAVAGNSKHIPEAVEFLKFLGSAENLNRYNADFGSFPPREDGWFGFVEEDAVMTKMGEQMAQSGRGFAYVPKTAQARDIITTQISLYLADSQDLDTTLQNIQSQYAEVLQP